MRYAKMWAIFALFLFVGLSADAAALEVTNVQAEQRPGAKLVDITYDLVTDDGNPVDIRVEISDDGGATFTVEASSFTGDVGSEVAPGFGKQIVWDAGADQPNVSGTRFQAKVIATAGEVSAQGRVWFLNPKTFGQTDNEIWSMAPDGSEPRREVELSFGSGYTVMAVKADGTEIAFVDVEDGRYKLKLRRASGGFASEIYDAGQTPIRALDWAPDIEGFSDGNRLGFVLGLGSQYSNDQFIVIDVRSLEILSTSQGANVFFSAFWSPDGTQIIAGTSTIWAPQWGGAFSMNPDGSGQTSIFNAENQNGPVALSPDGSRVAYARKDKGIFLANPDGTRQTQISAQLGYRIVWSPDGTELMFEDQDASAGKLYRMKADGSDLQVITPKTSGRFSPLMPRWMPF